MKSINILFFLVLIVFSSISCESEYSKVVKRELKKEIKNDSIFFGLYFGETRQEFYDRCWELNRQKIITHGGNNQFVKYALPSKNKENILEEMEMLFYGIFDEENIMRGMDIRFRYRGWSIWDKKYQADSLLVVVKDTLEKWYPGNSFFKVDIDSTSLYIKVDGNRQIKMYPTKSSDKQDVIVKIEDIGHLYKKYK